MIKQQDAVLDYIKQNGSISSMEAFKDLGVTRLSAIIFNLKKNGHKLKSFPERSRNRYGAPIRYSRYFLNEE